MYRGGVEVGRGGVEAGLRLGEVGRGDNFVGNIIVQKVTNRALQDNRLPDMQRPQFDSKMTADSPCKSGMLRSRSLEG